MPRPKTSSCLLRFVRACVLVLGVCLGIFGKSKAQVIDELTIESGEQIGCGADSTDFYAQSFFADVWKVTRFGVWLRRTTPNAFVRLSLAPDRAGRPALDSLIYESAYINPNDIGQLYVIDGLNEFVELNKKYWIVVDGYLNPATTGYAAVGTSSTFTDSFEPLYRSEDGGSTWQSLPGVPMSIFVEGDTCTFSVDLFSGIPAVCSDQVPVTLDAGAGYAHYDWNTGDTTSSIQVNMSGSYHCTVIDSIGCVAQDTVDFTVFAYPDAMLPDSLFGCEGQTLLLEASSIFSDYLWQDGSNGTAIAVDTQGQYTVRVTDSNGCVGWDTSYVSLETRPSLYVGPDTSFCLGGSVLLFAPPGYLAYQWSTGETDESVLVDFSAAMWVDVTTSLGCIFTSDTLQVNVLPLPPVPLLTQVDSVLSTPLVAGYSYQWTQDGSDVPGATANQFAPGINSTVTVIVTDGAGCSNESGLYLFQYEPDTTGSRFNFIPSGFSPNGDGVNDAFFFPSANAVGGVHLKIVNRWGDIVFEADPYLNDWTGSGRGGEQLPAGNYYYSVEYHNGEAARQGVVLMNR